VARVSVSIPLVDPANNRPYEVRCFRFGHFVVIGAGNRVASLDLRNNTRNGPGPLLWSSEGDFESAWDYETAAMRAWQRQRGLLYDTDTSGGAVAGSRAGELCAAGPLGVIVRQGGTLRAFDPLDGQVLWQRDGLAATGPTFSDWEYLFLTTPGKADGVIVSMIDGSTVGTWKRPPNKWLASVGRHIATLKRVRDGQQLEITNVHTGEKPLTRLYDRKATIAQVGGDSLAVMDPSGRAELIDLLSAKVEFEVSLLPEPQLESLHVVRDGEVLYWGINSLSKAQQSEAGYVPITGAPLVSGRLYSLDASTGTAHWKTPAVINGLGIAPLQTPAAPVLLLVSHLRKTPNATATETTRVLALDKRNGRSIVREEGMAALETHGYWVQADRVSHRKVAIDLERTLLTLEYTDAPRPPEPVAQSDIEVGIERKEGSIWGIFGNLGVTPEPPPLEDDDD
jgi:outer membrane protein assembly factor BamB